MKKAKLLVSGLCMVAVLAFAMPAAVYADEGPQGGVKSTKDAPPPPPPSSGGSGFLGALIAYLLS
jgi:hypothetical protein